MHRDFKQPFKRHEIDVSLLTRTGKLLHSFGPAAANQQCLQVQSGYTRGVQKVLQLDHKEEWKCYKLHFIFQHNPYWVQCICDIFVADC